MELSRNLLAGALGALGKLVCRTSPVEAYRSVLIEGKENKISFRTAGNEESVTFTVDCDNAGEFSIAVNFQDRGQGGQEQDRRARSRCGVPARG